MALNSIPNNNYCCSGCVPCQPQMSTANLPQGQVNTVNQQYQTLPQPQVNAAGVPNVQYQQPQYAKAPQMQINQPQTVQVPANTSGVNIQIFNPSVSAPGAPAPTYNVNSPSYYPPNYYTGQMGNGNACCCCNGAGNNGGNNPNGANTTDANNANNNGVNNNNNSTTNTNETNKKTETKKIVELTDQYIMNLENYLNSQDKDVRLNAAKEVYARLEEDPSRKDDKALTALINKMLQDPNSEVRMLALAALDGRYVQGDDFTVNLLQNMQSKPDGYGQDAIDAAEILLKMSGRQVEKEVEVDPARQKKTVKTETKKETKKG